MAELAEPVEPPRPASRSFRIWYCVIQTVVLAVFAGLCWISEPFNRIYDELGVTRLPPPTALCLALGKVFKTAGGLLLLGGVDALLIGLGLSGKLDRVLRILVIVNVVGTLLMVAFFSMSVYGPIVQIRETLENK